MAHDLTLLSCTAFAERLASRDAVPGGGGAAALAGALGTALCAMAGNLTLGRKKYADAAPTLRALLARCERVRTRLLELVELDADHFAPLAAAYAIPRDDPNRQSTLDAASVAACAAPLEMMRCCADSISLLSDMLETCSALLISDVGCGAYLCKAAMQSASLNIYINTRTLADRGCAASLNAEADGLLSKYLPLADRVADDVARKLRGEASV